MAMEVEEVDLEAGEVTLEVVGQEVEAVQEEVTLEEVALAEEEEIKVLGVEETKTVEIKEEYYQSSRNLGVDGKTTEVILRLQ